MLPSTKPEKSRPETKKKHSLELRVSVFCSYFRCLQESNKEAFIYWVLCNRHSLLLTSDAPKPSASGLVTIRFLDKDLRNASILKDLNFCKKSILTTLIWSLIATQKSCELAFLCKILDCAHYVNWLHFYILSAQTGSKFLYFCSVFTFINNLLMQKWHTMQSDQNMFLKWTRN